MAAVYPAFSALVNCAKGGADDGFLKLLARVSNPQDRKDVEKMTAEN